MLDELKLLEELQRVDLQVLESERALQELPAKLQSMRKDVSVVEALLEKERKQLRDVQAYVAELTSSLKNDQDQIGRAKTKMQQVRNSREYMAVQREFETNRRLIGEREEEVKKLSAAIEETQQSIATHEKELAELHRHLVEEEQITATRIAEIETQVAGQRAEREQTAERISKPLLRRYDHIRRLRGGISVVTVKEGVCTGCRMHLPPQLYNILQRFNSIEQCPTCQRILVFAKPPAEEESAASDAS